MASKVADKQKCPNCGVETDTKEIAKDMESVCQIAEKMDYGEPEVQCPICSEWFYLQTVKPGKATNPETMC